MGRREGVAGREGGGSGGGGGGGGEGGREGPPGRPSLRSQSEGGYPNGLCFPCANVWRVNHGQKLLSSLSRCRRAPPRAMYRKIRRARPPLSYAVSIRTHRRGDPPVRSTQSRYGCFNKNNPPRRPTRKIDTTAVCLFQ